MCVILPSFTCASPGMLEINFCPWLELFTFFVLKSLCRVVFGPPEYGGSFVGGWALAEMDARFHTVFEGYKDCPGGCIALGPHSFS